jgi:hypothetical protein
MLSVMQDHRLVLIDPRIEGQYVFVKDNGGSKRSERIPLYFCLTVMRESSQCALLNSRLAAGTLSGLS